MKISLQPRRDSSIYARQHFLKKLAGMFKGKNRIGPYSPVANNRLSIPENMRCESL
jgi:hypothetical protein